MLNLAPVVAVELALDDEFVHLLQIASLVYYHMTKVASGNFACADGNALVTTDEYGVVSPCIDKAVGVETLAGNGYLIIVATSIIKFVIIVVVAK